MDDSESVASLGARYAPAVAETARQILDEGLTLAKVEELAMVAEQYADRELEAWRALPTSPKVACRVGCSSCCHAPVGIAIPEAILIAETLRAESTDDELAALIDKTRRAESARLGLVGRERDRLRHPCPLLDEADGACSIYEIRPLNCRGWNSLDASRCESYFDDPTRTSTIPIDGIRRTISQAIAAGLSDGLESRALEHATVNLSTALRIILEDPTAADRWLAGEPSFRDAEVAGDPHEG